MEIFYEMCKANQNKILCLKTYDRLENLILDTFPQIPLPPHRNVNFMLVTTFVQYESTIWFLDEPAARLNKMYLSL